MSRKPPHVLLICIDALRYDCVNWQPQTPYFDFFGLPRRLHTPTLDDLAAQAVRFPRAVSHAGYTPPSLATTLTGTYSYRHGVVDFQNTTCRAEAPALPERFARQGYRTAAVCGPEWFAALGLTRGVQHSGHDERLVLDLLDRPEPLFAFVHFNDVHSPYGYFYWDHPAADNRDFALFMWVYFGVQVDLQRREFIDAQGRRAGLDQWDRIIGSACAPADHRQRAAALFKCYLHGLEKFDQTRLRLFIEGLRTRAAWDDAVICVFADHGEIVAPRMPWVLGHGKFLLEQLQRVPLLLKASGLTPRDVGPLVGLVDVAPTLLELAGLPADPDGLDGRALTPAITANRPVQDAYYQEGWSVLVGEQRQRPVLYQRALRDQRDRKLLATGLPLDDAAAGRAAAASGDGAAVDEDEFLRTLVERGLGEIAWPATCDELRTHLRSGMSRGQLAAAVQQALPRYQAFDVGADPFEQHGTVVGPGGPHWSEFAALAAELDRLTGRPNFADAARLSAGQEQQILEHLGALGYIEV